MHKQASARARTHTHRHTDRWYLLSRPIRGFVARFFPLYGTGAVFRADPPLPAGLAIDPASGVVSGTPAPDGLDCGPTLHRIYATNRSVTRP